ncbi:hypothetical protein KR018_005092 [Drosophila ironensis]|nr:hypothetical protein KR018_005092 [Drosophila ironensis]
MLRHKRNVIQTPSDAEHVKLKEVNPLLYPPQQPQVPPLLQRLHSNQHLNTRVTFCLELYHKNVIKKLPGFGKSHVIRVTKNVSQT